MTALTGTGGLIRLILRRDRVLLPLWVFLIGLTPASIVAPTEALYSTAEARLGYAATSGTNPTFLALYGPLFGTDLGGIIAQRASATAVILGLISLLTVIRHSRTEEEAGRRELVGSTVVGRQAGLAAALTVTMAANLVLGAVLALGVIGAGLPVAGSIAFGLQYAAVGCVFAAVGGVTAQLTEGSGAARGMAISVLGAMFVVRVAGDAGGAGNGLAWLSWLSPIGWAHRLRPYADERWWVLALVVGFIAVLVAVAAAVSARRDVGAGVFAARLGPAGGAPGLRSPLALAWRLHRSLLFGWTAGLTVLGFVYGSVAKGVIELVEENPQLEDVIARIGGPTGIVDAFLATITGVLALIAGAYAIQAALRLRTEEAGMRAEPVLATAVGRLRWAASHLAFSILGPTTALLVSGLAMGVTHGLNTGAVGTEVPRVLAAALVQLPAVWVLAAIAVALFGLLPRFAAVSWGALVVCVLVTMFGAVLGVDQRVLDVSPFVHIPKLPGEELTVTPLVWLAVLAAALTAAGLAGFRRRDVG